MSAIKPEHGVKMISCRDLAHFLHKMMHTHISMGRTMGS